MKRKWKKKEEGGDKKKQGYAGGPPYWYAYVMVLLWETGKLAAHCL
jgi:hypothetical protein